MPLFLVMLHFKLSNFFSIVKRALQSVFHSVQSLVRIELDAFLFFKGVSSIGSFFSAALITGRLQICLYLLYFPCYEDH